MLPTLGDGPSRCPSKTLSTADLDEKRAKGLCFWCDEKHGWGHKCKKRQLYRIEMMEEDYGIEEDEESDGNVDAEENEGNLAHISLCAMTSTVMPKSRTMRVNGHVGTKNVNIFIDCGSSHNFIHPNVVKKLGLRTKEIALWYWK